MGLLPPVEFLSPRPTGLKSIPIAIADPGRQGEIRLYGTITNDLHALEKALARIRKAHPGADLDVAYEAGPCGFTITRRLAKLKVPCLVATPSLIPKQPCAPFKTDKRDAQKIARLLRAGELNAAYITQRQFCAKMGGFAIVAPRRVVNHPMFGGGEGKMREHWKSTSTGRATPSLRHEQPPEP